MNFADPSTGSNERGALKRSPRCYHWLLVWLVITAIWTVGIVKRGATTEIWLALAVATVFLGYMLLIDMSTRIWWTTDQIWWRDLDYFSLKPMRHTIRMSELTEVVTSNHPTNSVLGKPFDRLLLVSPNDTITILLSFQHREEVEDLLRLIKKERPEVFRDAQVVEFMEGGFADWWR